MTYTSKSPRRYSLRSEMRGWTIIDRHRDRRVGHFYSRGDARLCRDALNVASGAATPRLASQALGLDSGRDPEAA